jgi:hypothetical protein
LEGQSDPKDLTGKQYLKGKVMASQGSISSGMAGFTQTEEGLSEAEICANKIAGDEFPFCSFHVMRYA